MTVIDFLDKHATALAIVVLWLTWDVFAFARWWAVRPRCAACLAASGSGKGASDG
jgi:hypothetical protein